MSAMISWKLVSCVTVTLALSLFVDNVETARNRVNFFHEQSRNEIPNRALLFEELSGPTVWSNPMSDYGAVQPIWLKGTAYSRPSCMFTQPDVIDCFYRGEDGSVVQQSVVADKVVEPVSIGGETYGNIQCVKLTRTSVACFTRGKENYLSFAIRTDGKWGAWSSSSQAKVSEIGRHSCNSRSGGKCSCVFRVETDRLARFTLNNGKLTGVIDPSTASKTFHSAFSCAILQGDSLECFGLDFNNTLFKYVRNRSTGKRKAPSNEDDFQGQRYLFSDPSITTVPRQQVLHVFGVAEGNKPVHIMYNQTHGFHRNSVVIGSRTMVESPDCVATQANGVFCFAVSSDSALYMAKFDGDSWGEWSFISSSFLENPSCVLWHDGTKISCFLRSFQRSLVKIDISTSNTATST